MSNKPKKIVILGGAGRVGMQIAAELLRAGQHTVLVDIVPQAQFSQLAGRLLNDARLAVGTGVGRMTAVGDIDALDKPAVRTLLTREVPDLVINYAIPITWDATKRLTNYARVSAAGLGAFTPIQVLAPLTVAQVIAEAGLPSRLMVGNLPDITIPVITGIARSGAAAQPLCGAGNVGLNQVAMRRQIAEEQQVDFESVEVALVSHHVHWVAPREPGYSNAAPFLAQVKIDGADVSEQLGDLRALMNRGVQYQYEPGAAFSSTTGILASRVALALLDDSDVEHRLHTPAPNGLPGGYPVCIIGGQISVDLPDVWQLETAVAAMEDCQALDGVEKIGADGSVRFTDYAREILREELQFELPELMAPADIEEVALAQIAALQQLFRASGL